MDQSNTYGAHSIKVMEGLDAVRKRPGMYIGSTDSKGLHHLIYEVVDNSVDEALAGHCSHIVVTLTKEGGCRVLDNGRGIPVDIHPEEKISAAEVVMTKLHAGGKFDKATYAFSGGLHGVGISVVNALSSHLTMTIYRDQKVHQQKFKQGIPLGRLEVIEKTEKKGTAIEFVPDQEIFKQTHVFSYEILAKRLKEIAYLNRGLKITLIDERQEEIKEEEFLFTEGIVSFVRDMTAGEETITDVIYYSYQEKEFEIEVALQYANSYHEKIVSFVNTINTHEGGTHVAGFKSALTSSCNKKSKEFKYDEQFTQDDLREGLVVVLNVKIADPQFEGQTKAKLSNFEIKGIVQSHLSTFFNEYFEENPSVIKKILDKAELARKAREAARRARELTRKKGGIDSSILSGKLADCSSNNPEETEMFIVEGNSAGGSAKMGRDRMTQAILPLRGKILNVEKTTLEKMLANSEIKSLVAAIGAGFGNESVIVEDCRYHKIIIMTDADVDGAHIRTLLLTFIYKYMRPLIEAGFVYIAQPPLYKIKIGKKEQYLKNDTELFDLFMGWVHEEVAIIVDGEKISEEKKVCFLDAMAFFYKAYFDLFAKTQFTLEEIEEQLLTKTDQLEEKTDESIKSLLQGEEYQREKNNLPFNKTLVFEYRNKTIGTYTLDSLLTFSSFLKTLAKPFMTIQRYKGLGEMNEDQLWETAMDPKTRQLKKLYVTDLVETEGYISLLMGEDVAPRKEFIEANALRARNIDV
jgi:DNA gyrase subunit B